MTCEGGLVGDGNVAALATKTPIQLQVAKVLYEDNMKRKVERVKRAMKVVEQRLLEGMGAWRSVQKVTMSMYMTI